MASSAHRFILSGSVDGHVKFWIQKEGGIEFVKHFRAHIGKLATHLASYPPSNLAS